MATSPQYAASVAVGAVLLNATETNLQVPTAASVVLTAGANGTKVEEIVVQASKTTLISTTVAGLVYIFLYAGSTYYNFYNFTVTAITGSPTVSGYRSSAVFNNLFLPSGWSIYASQSEASNAGVLEVFCLGGSY